MHSEDGFLGLSCGGDAAPGSASPHPVVLHWCSDSGCLLRGVPLLSLASHAPRLGHPLQGFNPGELAEMLAWRPDRLGHCCCLTPDTRQQLLQ